MKWQLAHKRPKYNTKITVLDDIKFRSKKEAKYYAELKLRRAGGEVKLFLRQVPIDLPGNTRYFVDFVEFMADGRVRFVDVKGVRTQMYKLKKRQVEAIWDITIEEA